MEPVDLTKRWYFGDITFIVEKMKIYANKATLSMSSEVFRSMFNSEFAEKMMTEIPLPDKRFDDFLDLMEVLHPQILRQITDTNVHYILPLAHEYQMHAVFRNCVKVLSYGPPSIMSLILEERYNLKLQTLKQRCLKYLNDTSLSELKQEDGYRDFNPEILIEVLNAKVEKLEPLKTEVGKIASWKDLNKPVNCSTKGHGRHREGSNSYCSGCIGHRFNAIGSIMKKHGYTDERKKT